MVSAHGEMAVPVVVWTEIWSKWLGQRKNGSGGSANREVDVVVSLVVAVEVAMLIGLRGDGSTNHVPVSARRQLSRQDYALDRIVCLHLHPDY